MPFIGRPPSRRGQGASRDLGSGTVTGLSSLVVVSPPPPVRRWSWAYC